MFCDNKLFDIIKIQFPKWEYICNDFLSITSEVNDENSIFSIYSRDDQLIKSDSISSFYSRDEQSIKTDPISLNFFRDNQLFKSGNETQDYTFLGKKRKRDLFEITKKGRKKKNQKKSDSEIRCHDKNCLNNAIRKIMHSCNQKIYTFITTKLHKNQKIKRPTIENQIGRKYEEYNQFFKNTYYKILCNTIPKRYKGQKIKRDKIETTVEEKERIYQYNKKELDDILKNDKTGILFELLNLTFGEFFKAYLNDELMIKKNETFISLEGFETFKQCFNEGDDSYTKEQKEKYKEKLLVIAKLS